HRPWRGSALGREGRQPIVVPLGPAVFDRHVPPLDIPGLAEALAERAYLVRVGVWRAAVEKADHRQFRLLGARHEPPCRSRAAEHGDDIAPTDHSITSSA